MSCPFSEIRFIFNPTAGARQVDLKEAIRSVFKDTDVHYEIQYTEYKGHGTILARKAVDEGIDLVVAVGGDGTFNEIGQALVNQKIALGLIPLGSGNGLARALNIPLHVKQACQILYQGHAEKLDVGKIGTTFFFSTAGLGMDVEVSRRYHSIPKFRWTVISYGLLSGYVFLKYKPETISIKLEDGSEHHVTPWFLTIANSDQYGNGAIIAPDASPFDGILDLCIIENISLFRFLWHARRLFTRSIDRMPGTRFFRAKHLQIIRQQKGPYQIDGEVFDGPASLEVSIIPKAITMVLPTGIDDD